MTGILTFTGHLHPVLVHLPLGILLMGLFLFVLARRPAYTRYRQVVPLMFLVGSLTALLSCLTGYVQSVNAAYDAGDKNWHMWMGITTAFVSLLVYSRSVQKIWDRQLTALAGLLFILLLVTGHLGGTLTHGPGYLSLSSRPDSVKKVFPHPIPHIQEAEVYADLIHPILIARCVHCHGPVRDKGRLKLDDPAGIMAGGKSGKAIVPGKPEAGELLRRIMLGGNNKEHMPPRDEAQLEPREIALLKWWLGDSADFHKTVNRMPVVPGIRPILAQLETGIASVAAEPDEIPQSPVAAAPADVLRRLRDRGVGIQPVALTSNYLAAFFRSTPVNDSSLALLENLKSQLIVLHLGGTALTDSGMRRIGALTSLRRLYLNDTRITDSGLGYVKSLPALRYINLVNTKITLSGLSGLSRDRNLRSIYLFGTGITRADWPKLQALFPKATLDSGGYRIPTLATDTTVK